MPLPDLAAPPGGKATFSPITRVSWLQGSRWRASLAPLLAGGLGAAGVLAMHLRDPHEAGAWGLCPSWAIFGVYCPGCGGLRAVHNLTEGQVLDAVHSNMLALPLMALFGLWVVDGVGQAWRGKPMRLPAIGPITLWAILGFLALYTLIRNTPWGAWLTPV